MSDNTDNQSCVDDAIKKDSSIPDSDSTMDGDNQSYVHIVSKKDFRISVENSTPCQSPKSSQKCLSPDFHIGASTSSTLASPDMFFDEQSFSTIHNNDSDTAGQLRTTANENLSNSCNDNHSEKNQKKLLITRLLNLLFNLKQQSRPN